MSMFNIFNVSGSAVSAQAQRLNAVASNLANADAVEVNLSGGERSGTRWANSSITVNLVQYDRTSHKFETWYRIDRSDRLPPFFVAQFAVELQKNSPVPVAEVAEVLEQDDDLLGRGVIEQAPVEGERVLERAHVLEEGRPLLDRQRQHPVSHGGFLRHRAEVPANLFEDRFAHVRTCR